MSGNTSPSPPTSADQVERGQTQQPELQPPTPQLEVPQSPALSSTSTSVPTRTVAIIKNHALKHRLEIEPRILEASFEIVKERQMQFDLENDREALYELFGEDAESLAEGPVWVYVLQRRRAVEVWIALMGDPDPGRARTTAPNSLRALYGGSSRLQNGFIGSTDVDTAEMQITSLFASSPPWPTSDLPDDSTAFDTIRSVSSSILSALRRGASEADEGYAPSSATNPSTSGGTKLTINGKPVFRARAVPATNAAPDIAPRTTKAAQLRASLGGEKAPSSSRWVPHQARAPPTKERLAQTFTNVPGHKRSESITVASTAPPVVAPRMTRAAALRLGTPLPDKDKTPAAKPKLQSANTFEGVPGHKRRDSIPVASVQAPTVAPRLNKSAALRAQKEGPPPSSFMFKMPSAPKVPTLTRSNSTSSFDSSPSRPRLSRPPSQTSVRSPSVDPSESRQLAPRPSSTAPPPTIAPRSNRAALLRAQMQADAAAAAAKKTGPKRRPSSVQMAVVV